MLAGQLLMGRSLSSAPKKKKTWPAYLTDTTADACMHHRLQSFKGLGVDVSHRFVRGEVVSDDVKCIREEGLDELP